MRELQAGRAVPALTPRAAAAGGTAAVVVALDQASKEWALRALADGPLDLFWTLRFDVSINSGVAFGLGRGLGPIVAVGAVALLVVLVALGASAIRTWLGTLALGLVVGGALGNLADRVFRNHGGVVDFIDFQWWPVFNVADIAISVGAVLLVLAGRGEAEPERAPATVADTGPGDGAGGQGGSA